MVPERTAIGGLRGVYHQLALGAFEADVRHGFLYVQPLDDRHALDAVTLASRLSRHGLRTLDALHLAIARDIGAPLIATADRLMANAATTLGLEVAWFD